MTNTPANDKLLNNKAEQLTLVEQLKRAELFNGRAAMLGIVIGIVVEGLTGFGIAHQIGLGALVDGYAACRTQFLPFCFRAISKRCVRPPWEGTITEQTRARVQCSGLCCGD